jgi:hydrogenase maturation protein HypF
MEIKNMDTVTISISGTVQGVGFRPFIARTASELGLKGYVCNTDEGVLISVNADHQQLDKFILIIKTESPKLAVINRIKTSNTGTHILYNNFSIEHSTSNCKPTTEIAPDTALCEKCLVELNSESDRRYNHSFINCTDCGPRYSIIKAIPYDRLNTTMKQFPMCQSCSDEFTSIDNRRYHAQPICCPDCGPSLKLILSDGSSIENDTANILTTAISMLSDEKILAIKGIGGFHLACRADSKEAIMRLRSLKLRHKKPFACMVKNIDIASLYANLTMQDKTLLSSPQAPIVLVKKQSRFCSSLDFIAPGLSEIGLMLPYTPVHHLLFRNAPYNMLVMTSANNSHEPMYIDDSEITESMGILVDAVLTHNRSIAVRLDDSVVKSMKTGTTLIRRGRGFTPSYIETKFDLAGIVGFGGQLKNSLAFGLDKRCFISEYLGSIDNPAVADESWKAFERLCGMLKSSVSMIVSDLHPVGLSEDFSDWNIPNIKVQHHFAHAAACMGENGLEGKTICVIYDGTGLGDDGAVWGGEILIADYTGYQRVAHLEYSALPGNDAAVLYPGRCALSYCKDIVSSTAELLPWMQSTEHDAVLELISNNVHSTKSSSMGRLFDACAAILDICRLRTYEGQCAIELENAADENCLDSYEYEQYTDTSGTIIMSGKSILKSVLTDRNSGVPSPVIAARFHNAVTDMTTKTILEISKTTGIKNVVLSGGCFCNRLLTERIFSQLSSLDLIPHVHRLLPPGDENISFGQVLVAAALRSKKIL